MDANDKAQSTAQKSNSMLGHVDQNPMSPQKEDPFSKSLRLKASTRDSGRGAFESNLKAVSEIPTRRNMTI